MSDKRKGKASSSKKRKRTPDPTLSSLQAYGTNPLHDIDKANQLLPAQDMVKFSNLYCELRFPTCNSKNLTIEKKLVIPSDLTDIIHQRIDRMGLAFVDRKFSRVNRSWVQKFYCNFFRHTLDLVLVRGVEIPITEEAIEDAHTCRPKTGDNDAFLQAEIELHYMTFDFDALRAVVATPEASWVMDADNKTPKGMRFTYLSREAKTWQQIFAHNLMPTTHFSEIPVAMLILISCVLEGKKVYFPRLIRRFMWRAHIRGSFPFPVLVTQMIQWASVQWLPEDVSLPPPLPEKEEVTIPWGSWRSNRQLMHHLDRIDEMFVAQSLKLPPLPESSELDEETHEEEHADLHDEGTHEEEPVIHDNRDFLDCCC
ncbi:hypothetical protein Ahy_A05g024220 [Arachis hypogaea]|uniref:Putative plant transposon protein domain-containing protein n=1 Tax=Arachis hypogaea TaxID=3818 RepID=A0A445D5G7_ARAHY|nr:hypothetical protein Ahy_A05g024220 [Arachis hypogaea]